MKSNLLKIFTILYLTHQICSLQEQQQQQLVLQTPTQQPHPKHHQPTNQLNIGIVSPQPYIHHPQSIVISQQTYTPDPWLVQQYEHNQNVEKVYQVSSNAVGIDTVIDIGVGLYQQEGKSVGEGEGEQGEGDRSIMDSHVERFGFVLSEAGAQTVFKWSPDLLTHKYSIPTPNQPTPTITELITTYLAKISLYQISKSANPTNPTLQLYYPFSDSQDQAQKLDIFARQNESSAYGFVDRVYHKKLVVLEMEYWQRENDSGRIERGYVNKYGFLRFANNYPFKVAVSVTIYPTYKRKLGPRITSKYLQTHPSPPTQSTTKPSLSLSLSKSKQTLTAVYKACKELELERERTYAIQRTRLSKIGQEEDWLMWVGVVELGVVVGVGLGMGWVVGRLGVREGVV